MGAAPMAETGSAGAGARPATVEDRHGEQEAMRTAGDASGDLRP